MADLRLILAADCPKVIVNKIMDPCGVVSQLPLEPQCGFLAQLVPKARRPGDAHQAYGPSQSFGPASHWP
jgi:hypothetical protein